MIISKKTKIFLLIFSLIFIAMTVGAIIYTNYYKKNDESQVIFESPEKVSFDDLETEEIEKEIYTVGTSLDDVYNNNGIIYYYEEDTQNDVPITYPVIDGLKDESIEESVNKQITERINKILSSNNFKNNSDNTANVKSYVVANFADVLSVRIDVQFTENYNKNYGVSFELNTGERIYISDLFTSTAPKKNIITKSAYTSFALDYYTAEGLSNDFYTNIESDIMDFLLDYNNGKVTEFSFTPLYIELYREGKTVKINMVDYYQYIAIYNKFDTSGNIYNDTSNVAKGIPVFTKRPDTIIDLYEKVNDTCILDVCILKSEEEFSSEEMEVIETYAEDLKEKISNVKNEVGIYYSNYITVSKGVENDEDILIFTEEEKLVTASEENFAEIYAQILGAERDISNEDYIGSKILILGNDNIISITTEIKYYVNTAKEVEEETEQEEEEIEEEEDQDNENERSVTNETSENSNVTNSTSDNNIINQDSTTNNIVTGNVTIQVIF